MLRKHQKQVKFHVDSKYSILETIGEGAYGVVCSAVDTTTGQRVAIKKICDVFDVPAITKRTLRELKILKHFKHDNIIGIKEILRPPADMNEFRDVYVVLDLMGSDLHHIIHSKQDLSEEHVRYFLYQLLRGLKYIHSANIIHRDLKPSNLLINKDCELKIGDFGMARSLAASATEQKRVMTEYVATRWYRAPELMLSLHQFTKAIDIWSVGCIFAEMLGRTALFPGSNYLNQLQLILSVVGIPSVEFMSTITSDRVRHYISRLPHKEAVSFSAMYPNASTDAINLLTQLLVLDPRKRMSVENALNHIFVEKYHDLDDEPTCHLFHCDLENLPLNKQILKDGILKEIQDYHSKRPRPKLAPVQTEFLKPFLYPKAKRKTADNDEELMVCEGKKQEARKRKQKMNITPNVKKKITQTDVEEKRSELSDQDKELLQRWSNMQKDTKPFIHPIRQHMDELIQLKVEAIAAPETVKGQAIIDRVSNKQSNILQFTNFVPKERDGGVALVREQTIRIPPAVNTASTADSVPPAVNTASTAASVPPAVNTASTAASVVTSTAAMTTIVASSNKILTPNTFNNAPMQTILIPLGSMPMFQLRGAFNGAAPIVIFPNISSQKVNAPIPIAPKPTQLSGVSIQPRPMTQMTSSMSTNTILVTTTTITATSKATVSNVSEISKSIKQMKNHLLQQNRKFILNPPITDEICANAMKTKDLLKASNNSRKHFDKRPAGGERLSYPSSAESDNKTDSSTSKEGKFYINPLYSASSGLSDLSINSADLVSSVEISSAESEETIAKIKLDDEDKKIVNIIEELEEKNEHESICSGSTGECDVTQPCTTVQSFHTDNWSIVKNMLVNTIRARQMKEEQEVDATTVTYANRQNFQPLMSNVKNSDSSFDDLKALQLSFPNIPSDKISNPLQSDTSPSNDLHVDVLKKSEFMPALVTPKVERPNVLPNMETRVSNTENRLTCNTNRMDDIFLTTFVDTPKTPRSGAAGYGLGMDFEDLFAGSSIDLLNPLRSAGGMSLSHDPQLSASLLNEWLGMDELDPADIADLQRELESTSSSLLLDT